MRKHLLFFAILLGALLALPAVQANAGGTPTESRNPVLAFFDQDNPLNDLEAGPEISFYSYREPNFMKQKGNLYGAFLKYTHRTRENAVVQGGQGIDFGINMIRLEGRFNYGTVDYESEGTGDESGIDNYLTTLRGLLGYDINLSSTLRLTPYLGLGFRYLLDDGGGGVTTTGALGYDRESRYFYLPLGVECKTSLSGTWSLEMTAEYDFFIRGTQQSHLEDANPNYNTVKNDQHDGYGMQGSFKIVKENGNVEIYLEPFVRYWKIADSEISSVTYAGVAVGYGIEPENETVEYGFRLGFRY